MPRSRLSLARLAALVPLAGLMSGCVHPAAPGVAVKALPSDIAFGLKPKAAVPPLANPDVATPPAADQTVSSTDAPLPADLATPSTRPLTTISPKVSVPVCPPAAESAFPAQAATLGVSGPPAAGRYRWKEAVTQARAGTAPVTLTFFVDHDITHVSPVTQTPNPVPSQGGAVLGSPTGTTRTFNYDEVIHNADGTSTTTTYQVVEGAPQVNSTQSVAGAVPEGSNTNVGSPSRGVSLVKVVSADAKGSPTSTFAPSAPVVLLPLDVVSGGQFQSSGVAPDGSTLTVSGTIGKRARVDACGTIVDGWEVNSTQTFSSGGTASPLTTTYYVGTQLGGILTYVHKTLIDQLKTPTTPTVTESLGQLRPSPLPAGS